MDEIRLDDRVAIVTGAGRGLGRAHALLLAQRGAAVVVNDLGPSDGETTMSAADAVVAEIEAAGGTACANVIGVGTPEAAEQLVSAAVDTYGRLDVLVNNAGILRDRTLAKLTPEEFAAVVSVHLGGTVWTTRAAWPTFVAQGYGRVINTTSAAGIFGSFGQTNYSAAKAAIIGVTKTMAMEGARAGITANAIEPGAHTRMTEGLLGDLADQLDPALVSPLVLWLASEGCRETGAVYNAGGGRVARVLVTQTVGYFSPTPTAEGIAEHWAAINDPDRATVVADFAQEMAILTDLLRTG